LLFAPKPLTRREELFYNLFYFFREGKFKAVWVSMNLCRGYV
jgi:hypothetical protein